MSRVARMWFWGRLRSSSGEVTEASECQGENANTALQQTGRPEWFGLGQRCDKRAAYQSLPSPKRRKAQLYCHLNLLLLSEECMHSRVCSQKNTHLTWHWFLLRAAPLASGCFRNLRKGVVICHNGATASVSSVRTWHWGACNAQNLPPQGGKR